MLDRCDESKPSALEQKLMAECGLQYGEVFLENIEDRIIRYGRLMANAQLEAMQQKEISVETTIVNAPPRRI